MKLTEIIEKWDTDSKVVADQLGQQAADVAYLHNKYYKIYLEERARYRDMVSEQKSLHKLKFEYYTGTIDEETLRERQWKPFTLRVLKAEVPMYLDADKDVQEFSKRVELQKDKIEYLESIIKNINNRNFQIKNVLEFLRWSQGSI